MTHPTIPTPSASGTDHVTLRNGSRVSRRFYETIRQRVLATAPTLLPKVLYRAEHCCGPDFWLGMTNGERRCAGEALKDMAEADLVPLILVKWAHEYPCKYELK